MSKNEKKETIKIYTLLTKNSLIFDGDQHMKQITLDYTQTCTITPQKLAQTQFLLNKEIDRIIAAQSQDYKTDYASINLAYDHTLLDTVKNLAAEKLKLNPDILIIVGIGGSNLGTAAIVQALYGVLYNERSPLKIYFADTVDPDYIHEIVCIADAALAAGQTILLNVISKSGTTTETIANFKLFCDILKKHHSNNYKNYVVITTDENSDLHKCAQTEHIYCLIIPAKVGGRYSIFSAVGLFPLALANIDITQLCTGAQTALSLCTQKDDSNNVAATSAAIMYLLYKKGYTIHNSFFFSVALENLGKWYRQLMAESIGKKYDNNNSVVHNGILPTVSIGSTDLHSLAQLYLSGPYNIFTTFISVENHDHDSASFSTIMNAILEGTMRTYKNDNRPFVLIKTPEKTAYYLGQFMQIKMCEIMYLGFLMNVNPFDQPQVELHKKEVRKILEKKD